MKKGRFAGSPLSCSPHVQRWSWPYQALHFWVLVLQRRQTGAHFCQHRLETPELLGCGVASLYYSCDCRNTGYWGDVTEWSLEQQSTNGSPGLQDLNVERVVIEFPSSPMDSGLSFWGLGMIRGYSARCDPGSQATLDDDSDTLSMGIQHEAAIPPLLPWHRFNGHGPQCT